MAKQYTSEHIATTFATCGISAKVRECATRAAWTVELSSGVMYYLPMSVVRQGYQAILRHHKEQTESVDNSVSDAAAEIRKRLFGE